MNKIYFSIEKDGFYGIYYPNKEKSNKAVIAALGAIGDKTGMMAAAVKWLHKNGCNVMAVVPHKDEKGIHNFPLERIEKAIAYLKTQGNNKFGIIGASATSVIALAAASYIPDITLTVGLTPCDYVMEGYLRDKLDGVGERPADTEAIVSYKGEALPFLPYAYRHPQYWQEMLKESRETGNMAAARRLFNRSEELHPLQEEEKIRIENIRGRLILIGAEDDTLWETDRYIRRMKNRLENTPHECRCDTFIYKHGTHFVFPQSMLTAMIPLVSGLFVKIAFKAARQFPKECKAARIDIDEKLSSVIKEW